MMAESSDIFELTGHEYVSPEESERVLARFEWNLRNPDKIGKYPPDIYDHIKVSKD